MHNSTRLMLLAACLALMLQQSIALVDLGRLYPYGKEWMPPVTRWLLSDDPTVIPHEQILAWRKIGKIAHQHFITYLCLQLLSVSCCSVVDQQVEWQGLQVTRVALTLHQYHMRPAVLTMLMHYNAHTRAKGTHSAVLAS